MGEFPGRKAASSLFLTTNDVLNRRRTGPQIDLERGLHPLVLHASNLVVLQVNRLSVWLGRRKPQFWVSVQHDRSVVVHVEKSQHFTIWHQLVDGLSLSTSNHRVDVQRHTGSGIGNEISHRSPFGEKVALVSTVIDLILDRLHKRFRLRLSQPDFYSALRHGRRRSDQHERNRKKRRGSHLQVLLLRCNGEVPLAARRVRERSEVPRGLVAVE